MQKSPLESLYRKKAAAKILSTQENGNCEAIYRWLLDETRKGSIPEYNIGKCKYVRLSEVEEFIQLQRAPLQQEW